MRIVLVAFITSVVFGSLGVLGCFWWPAWMIAAILYGFVIGAYLITRPPRRRSSRQPYPNE